MDNSRYSEAAVIPAPGAILLGMIGTADSPMPLAALDRPSPGTLGVSQMPGSQGRGDTTGACHQRRRRDRLWGSLPLYRLQQGKGSNSSRSRGCTTHLMSMAPKQEPHSPKGRNPCPGPTTQEPDMSQEPNFRRFLLTLGPRASIIKLLFHLAPAFSSHHLLKSRGFFVPYSTENSFLRVFICALRRATIDECICETRDSERSRVAPISFMVISS